MVSDKEWKEQFPDNTEDNEGSKEEIQTALDTTKKYVHKLFIDEYTTPHAVISMDDHLEVFPIDGRRFKVWCRMIIYNKNGKNINTPALSDLCSLLSAYAQFEDKEEINLNLRFASREKGKEQEWIYDLTNKNWEFIKITSGGWLPIKNEIIFRRFSLVHPGTRLISNPEEPGLLMCPLCGTSYQPNNTISDENSNLMLVLKLKLKYLQQSQRKNTMTSTEMRSTMNSY